MNVSLCVSLTAPRKHTHTHTHSGAMLTMTEMNEWKAWCNSSESDVDWSEAPFDDFHPQEDFLEFHQLEIELEWIKEVCKTCTYTQFHVPGILGAYIKFTYTHIHTHNIIKIAQATTCDK